MLDISESMLNESCDQIAEMQQKLGHTIQSFSIDYLVEQIRKKHFFIPTFHRPLVWNNGQQRRFIESVILGFPIPFMFIAYTDDKEQFDILDGSQRLLTLDDFLSNNLRLENLEILSSLNGLRFSELSLSQQVQLKNRKLSVFILYKTAPLDIQQQMFRLFNSGHMSLNGDR